MAEPFVIVHRSFDTVQAEMLGDVLRDAGVAARVVGTRSGASIGMGQVAFHVHISVPGSQAGQATELLEAFLGADGAELLRAEGELPDDADEAEDAPAPRETPRRVFIAIGVGLLMPFGGAHLYARRPWTAALILAGQLNAMRYLGGEAAQLATAAIMAGLLAFADIVGAVIAVRAGRRGVRRGPLHQLGVGIAIVAAVVLAARALGTLAAARLLEGVPVISIDG
jgi:hypothetical protein